MGERTTVELVCWSNVRMCDVTYQVTLRWDAAPDVRSCWWLESCTPEPDDAGHEQLLHEEAVERLSRDA